MKKILFILSVLITISCSRYNAGAQVDLFTTGIPLGELDKKNLDEASGLAASVRNVGCLWTLNDSGNTADIFLIDQKADIKLICKLKSINNRDWEDIAVGPGPEEGKTYVYVGDIGDNTAQHPVKYIYRFEEPVKKDGVEEIDVSIVDRITFRLEGEQKDSETLLLDPKTKDLYLVTKREAPVALYQLKYPYNSVDTVTAKLLTTLPLTYIVGGCISPGGKEILLKNYDHIFYWRNNKKNRTVADILKSEPQKLPYKPEPQGEAIAWAHDGSGFFTVSETVLGKRSYLFFYKRKKTNLASIASP